MGGRAQLFQLLASEDIERDQVNLGMAVFSGLRGRHINDLARAALDHHKSVLAKGRTLHRIGRGGACIGAVEGMLMLSAVVISLVLRRDSR